MSAIWHYHFLGIPMAAISCAICPVACFSRNGCFTSIDSSVPFPCSNSIRGMPSFTSKDLTANG